MAKDKVETNKFALPALYRPTSFITEDIWRACPATMNGNEQAHWNVNRDSMNLTLLGGIMKGRAFDDWAAQSIDVHVSLGIGTHDRDSTHVYHASRSITRQALSQHCHVTQNNAVVRPSADNGHQDALQQPVPQRITPVPSYTLTNALHPDIRGVPESCLWPAQHTVYTYITTHQVVTSEFDDLLVPLHLTHVPISQFSTLDGALHG
ncbi:uncharacterized protein HD556DRAFT_1449897 [Suillus plorans]|uniref:Uncharacterized protein n=1 Tax=Suillus plorans TaxID=116603 RepID=A0A9P7ADU7_9AGAM|nr:uncharacterized protein HD556DRAFT_1449897 [Suillus plorans]KAG1786273.1 hypothetical protein HD556DRAFT_1449897 [Suillus plorans]